MPRAEVPTLMFQPKMLEIALPCIWLPMMDMWRHLIDHATSCYSMNCPVSCCDGRALADCRYCRLLGFCSKLALMRMPNALEAGPHFSSSNVRQFFRRLQHYSVQFRLLLLISCRQLRRNSERHCQSKAPMFAAH